MHIRPDTAGFVNQRLDALHNDLKRVGRKAIETLDVAANADAGGDALAATSTYARNAINELLQSFDRDAAFTESSLDANVLRSRDLLYVKDVDLDASFDPVSTEETRLLDRLLNTAAHADTMRGAFHDRLERNDFIGARLALDLLETEDGVDVDECIASFVHRINDRRKTLRTELRSTQKRLESAFCRGQLPVDDRDATAAALATLRQGRRAFVNRTAPNRRGGGPDRIVTPAPRNQRRNRSFQSQQHREGQESPAACAGRPDGRSGEGHS